MSRDAVIVSVARTPIGRAYKGAFNATPAPTLAAHAIRAAVARANVEPGEIEDCIVGSALPQGLQHTIGRTAALAAGLPISVAGQTVDRQCSSGLMSISMASKQIVMDRMDIVVAGGMDSISMVQTAELRLGSDPELLALHPDIYMPMIDTAEVVARRYGVSRELQDEYAFQSQRRTAEAQAAGRFDTEIIPVKTIKSVTDKATGGTSMQEVVLKRDEGNRPDTTMEGLASLDRARRDGVITAVPAGASRHAEVYCRQEPGNDPGIGRLSQPGDGADPIPAREQGCARAAAAHRTASNQQVLRF